ncbi:M48 family metallopeptidase [Candidatus Micrarchaeota archaeon]|nr:M48 family metallopeptidase [Candidatus Micrarchaeota archaeon]
MEKIDVNGKIFPVTVIWTKNRNAYARLRNETIIVSMPSRWPEKDREKTILSLVKRTAKEIARGRWTAEGSKKLEFFHGQRIIILGKELEVEFIQSKRFGGKLKGNKIQIKIRDHQEIKKKASQLVSKQIVKAAKPEILARIEHFNSQYFNAEISRLTLRDNISTWGSCSRVGLITLNLRLLFMPSEILDYVIVHELAHTKYMSHGKRFWGLVEKVLPDYKERRKWLRNNGWSVVPNSVDQQNFFPYGIDK